LLLSACCVAVVEDGRQSPAQLFLFVGAAVVIERRGVGDGGVTVFDRIVLATPIAGARPVWC
jgi:hypothetical protein